MKVFEFRCRLRYPSGFQVDADFSSTAPVTALVGPSGSGKTSVLSMLAGLREPDEGLIKVKDRVLFDSKQKVKLPPEARRVGYVFQQHLLFPHLSVRENLLFGWKRRNSPDRNVELEPLVEVLELGELLERMPGTLSGGQAQRVALGRALLSGPDLLLLDEPLASLEADLKDRLLDYIEEVIKRWGIPTVYVTHDRSEVKRLAQEVVELKGGRVVR